ncbi:major histocompatibility complex class I-related gene protein-like isoform X2 [Carcharodon carcharias]|uniref:major histocompatibility complex class I-related gene protein-like isoform X2 n=1 Tax=Carcharodon carcharias TaxID=13397 RepID=UPI001B7ECC11|nr:major histocompatibility complex class I-related gene protein-like isoform X2 [Carcharodon carcharias]
MPGMEDWNRQMTGLRFTLLSLCTAIGIQADFHTFQQLFIYYKDLPGVPEFSVVGMLDDLPTQYYDSSLRKAEPRQQWMADCFADDYWQEQTRTADALHMILVSSLSPFLNSFRITYILGIWSCVLQNNKNANKTGLVKMKNSYGEIQCEITTMRCSGIGLLALLNKEFESILNQNIALVQKLNTNCVQNLQSNLQAGKAALERKVAPEVLVFSKTSTDGSTSLLCLVTAFYPRAINATWLRNGDPVLDALTVTVLPNYNATYRMEILVDIEDNNPKSYFCKVQHSSLPKTLTVQSGVEGVSETIHSGPVLGLLLAIMGRVI